MSAPAASLQLNKTCWASESPHRSRAQLAWSGVCVRKRLCLVRGFRYLLAAEGRQLASEIADLTRRPVAEVLASEVLPLAEGCRFLQRNADQILATKNLGGAGRPIWLWGASHQIRREPFGLVLIIAPSNYPLLLPGIQVLQALVAGNSVLLKPGSGGLQAASRIADMLGRSGLPERLLEVLPEEPAIAQRAIGAGVDKVVFTGSAHTGKDVLRQLASSATPSTMELSGCDAVLIRADADLDLTAKALAFGLRLNSGRTCIAPKRAFVSRRIATELEGRLAHELSSAEPLVFDAELCRRLSPVLAEAITRGAHFLSGTLLGDGNVRGPVVLAGISPDSRLLREDFFAPVLALVTVEDDEEAVSRCNDSDYALGATVFSSEIRTAKALAARLRAGVVVINDMIVPTADPRVPFGGRGLSGFGVTRGAEGLLEMTTPKVVSIRKGRGRTHLDRPRSVDADLFHGLLRLQHGQGVSGRLQGLRQLIRAALARSQANSDFQ